LFSKSVSPHYQCPTCGRKYPTKEERRECLNNHYPKNKPGDDADGGDDYGSDDHGGDDYGSDGHRGGDDDVATGGGITMLEVDSSYVAVAHPIFK
jgi:hypothetical protein